MQADPLQQLRDIHLPPEPSWWPPAPGWWLLVLALLTLAAVLTTKIRQRVKRQAPKRYASQLYQQLYQHYLAGELTDTQYLNQTNEILKRLVIHTQGEAAAISASDQAWLGVLDQIAGTAQFSQGPGQVLGNQRFAAQPSLESVDFDQLIRRFIQGLKL